MGSVEHLYTPDHSVLKVQEDFLRTVHTSNGKKFFSQRQRVFGTSALVIAGKYRGFSAISDISEKAKKQVLTEAQKNLGVIDSEAKAEKTEWSRIEEYPRFLCDSDLKAMEDYAKWLESKIRPSCDQLQNMTVGIMTRGTDRQIWTSNGYECRQPFVTTSIFFSFTAENREGHTINITDQIDRNGVLTDAFEKPDAVIEYALSLYEDVRRKRQAVRLSAGIKKCVFSNNVTGIFTHESFGHLAEGDSVTAGSALLGKQEMAIASDLIHIVDFANEAFGKPVPIPLRIDDEGVICTDVPIISAGRLTGCMTDISAAKALGYANSTGNARSGRWSSQPIVRMRNTALLPGKSTPESMISDIEDGIYVISAKAGQSDPSGKFMLEIQNARVIRNGRLEEALQDMVCTGNSIQTLQKADRVGNDFIWHHQVNCGKMNQSVLVSVGGPSFRTEAFFTE